MTSPGCNAAPWSAGFDGPINYDIGSFDKRLLNEANPRIIEPVISSIRFSW